MDKTPRDRWHELWGTFSVKDHCRPGAFVAEVLLYDKLLIPVLPTVADGLTANEANRERQRWSKNAWNPERQQEILKILGERAERIPWTVDRQAEWQVQVTRLFDGARENGFFMTGTVLQRFAPAMARSVVAVSQYNSLDELKAAGIRRLEPEEKLPGGTLMAVLGHELLLPDDPGKGDLSILAKAVEVASDPNYRAKRRALYDWQQDFLTSDRTTDATSIKAAVQEMRECVDSLKSATKRQKGWKWAKRFFSLAKAASGCAALVFPPAAAFSATSDAVISVGAFVAEEGAEAHKSDRTALPAASLVLDAREKLGIE